MDFNLIMTIFAFLFGLTIGSFLNVCIYRLPRDLSLVYPPSNCPQCGQRISFYDNIPVVSYLWLRGRCRTCRNPIPLHYPVVELLSGLLGTAVFILYGFSFQTIAFFVFCAVLLLISFIDLQHKIIPDILSVPGALLGLVLAVFKIIPQVTWLDSLIGMAGGAGFFLLVAFLFKWLRKIDGMGMGDVKLLAMIGAWMGWRPLLFVVLIASLSGTLIGGGTLLLSRKKMDEKIPFGPFLVIGALGYFFFSQSILAFWYGLFAGY
ncbi:MAG: prepilin peptidase [Desulfobacteraceae bacterium]|nr:MAG: prepilin peptidase [Desulfobacteraceae bacterium]